MRPAYHWPDPDRDYANGAFIPQGADYPARWAEAAGRFRADLGDRAELDLPYGPGARQRLDLFLPETTPRGVVVFVHGGYWHLFSKAHWSHLAAGPLARGFAVAMPGYTLAPAARLAEITTEIAKACWFVGTRVPGPMVVTGHSAGGHLAARMGCTDLCGAGGAGGADLPADRTGAADGDRDEPDPADRCGRGGVGKPGAAGPSAGVAAHVWVGAAERPAFLWQARVLAEEWGCPWTADPARHHFDVIDGLEDPASPLCAALLDGL
jgi:arylformamidase